MAGFITSKGKDDHHSTCKSSVSTLTLGAKHVTNPQEENNLSKKMSEHVPNHIYRTESEKIERKWGWEDLYPNPKHALISKVNSHVNEFVALQIQAVSKLMMQWDEVGDSFTVGNLP